MLHNGQLVVIVVFMLAIGIITSQQVPSILQVNASNDSPYNSGYDHGVTMPLYRMHLKDISINQEKDHRFIQGNS